MTAEASSSKAGELRAGERRIGGHRRRRHLPAGPFVAAAVLVAGLCGAVGCNDPKWGQPAIDEPALRTQAQGYLKRAIVYPHLATVRCQAVEALSEEAPRGVEGWLIEALADDHPAVRFAACTGLGRMRHVPAKPMIEQRLGDENHSVRAAAIFALHRLGDYTHSGELAEMLLHHKDKEVRGNAAVLFGLLGEPKAVKLLERSRKDPAYMVVWQALEARLLLGDPEALPRVAAQANSGREDVRVMAMLALGRSGQQKSAEMLRYRLNREDDHIESRLAAARGLGSLGHQDGLAFARDALKFDDPDPDKRAGPPADQIMRVRSMAALALGAMRARSVLPELKSLMIDSEDPRIQLAAACAILQILREDAWPGASGRSAAPPPNR